ncbi:MAG TPA: hypothetical protein P5560_05975 [Thermotogota bacterium]|nr:hypothetical protein [Thermotogota bacterium]HRW92486.1 hypothetical protein [Thermotogota bacterium]
MKKSLLLFVFSILFLGVVAGNSTPVDVSSELDVYPQVKEMIDSGIMLVDSSGFFNGNLEVTRFQLANTLSRLRAIIMSSKPLTEVADLSKRVLFLEEHDQSLETSLKLLRDRVDRLEVTLSRQELEAMEGRLLSMKNEVLAQMQQLESKTSFISGYNDFLVAVEQELRNMYTRVEEQESRLTANEANVSRLLVYMRDFDFLEEWIPTTEASFTKSVAADRKMQQQLDQLQQQVGALPSLESRVSSIQSELVNMRPILQQAQTIGEIQNVLAISDQRLLALEVRADQVLTLSQDLDYIKIEYDRLKNEITTLKKQYWYAMGIGIAGTFVGAAALLYAYVSARPE